LRSATSSSQASAAAASQSRQVPCAPWQPRLRCQPPGGAPQLAPALAGGRILQRDLVVLGHARHDRLDRRALLAGHQGEAPEPPGTGLLAAGRSTPGTASNAPAAASRRASVIAGPPIAPVPAQPGTRRPAPRHAP
jgi:hypothetical protein